MRLQETAIRKRDETNLFVLYQHLQEEIANQTYSLNKKTNQAGCATQHFAKSTVKSRFCYKVQNFVDIVFSP